MKILFLTIEIPSDLSFGGMYLDLAYELANRGHEVVLMGGSQEKTSFKEENGIFILKVETPKIVGEKNKIKKGLAMASFSHYFSQSYKKFLKGEKFDWIILPTPPITLIDFVCKIKEKANSKLYLILRDIHPQAPWSLKEIPFKWMYNYLYKKSDKAYRISDIISTMSRENSNFVIKEHPRVNKNKFVILLNWLKKDIEEDANQNFIDIRKKFGLENKFIVLFGGNISLGQRVENIADLARALKDNKRICFVIIGKGIEKQRLIELTKDLSNVLFLDYMPRKEYMTFSRNVDLGLISINENNAVPTCPSKVVAYMSMGIPVLAMINRDSDYGKTYIEDPKCGFWSVGSDKKDIISKLKKLVDNPDLCHEMGNNGYNFYNKYLTVEKAVDEIERHIEQFSK